jgi:hypothetical protein
LFIDVSEELAAYNFMIRMGALEIEAKGSFESLVTHMILQGVITQRKPFLLVIMDGSARRQ